MTMQPLPGFKHFTSHHCVTGSLRHIFQFYDYSISEEMLLGLGEGVGFIYWHMKGTLPFLGGRANIERPGVEGLEKTLARRTGIEVEVTRTTSAGKAQKTLLAMLQAGQPVMLVLDMGFLPYFDFGGEEYHFGYHVVVACGYDPQTRQVLLADRDETLHTVSLDTLEKARGSKYQPFPPKHAWYRFDFSHRHPPEAEEIRSAIRQSARAMLHPPISNFGVPGIHKAARRIRDWPKVLTGKELRDTCINTAIMIDARGGTGGGLFRYMYARFLQETAELTGDVRLLKAGSCMNEVGELWEKAARLFENAYDAEEPGEALNEVCALLPLIAKKEERGWLELEKLQA